MAKPRCRDCGGGEWTRDGRCRGCRSFPTLGYQAADWIEAHCVVPDRDFAGEPFTLTDEQLRFLLWFYRLNPAAKYDRRRRLWRNVFYFVRGSQLTRPQKWGKGPFGAAIICDEAEGPAAFDGWDAAGLPVGRPWPTPLIQVTALSEDQTGNVWDALLPMIELGGLGAVIEDTGVTRINLAGGGKIEPSTSAPLSRLGQRIVFLLQDQTESWTEANGGRKLADNQRRNIAGMGGRWLSTPNAWDPNEDSVAQYTAEHEHDGVYHDDVDPPETLSIRNRRERRRALRTVYGDSWWVDLDRIDAEIEALLPRDPAQAERWFLNRKLAAEGTAFNAAALKKNGEQLDVEPGALIVIGVAGGRFQEALAIVATEVESGHQWPLGIWERPDHAREDYEHPFDDIDGAMVDAFEQFNVWRAYCAPQQIEPWIDTWQGRWGEKRVIPWRTNRPTPTAWAVRNYETAIAAGDMSHNSDPALERHIKNARQQKVNVYDEKHRQMHTLAKESASSSRWIGGAWAATLSWEARGDAIAGGATETVDLAANIW